jgi:hypothetical protein
MALKTFNIDAEVYKDFSEYCKKEGISMSKKLENFIRGELFSINLGAKKVIRARKGIDSGHHSFKKYC